ncbi:MAG: hypothetical protein FWC73_09915 [Defluviitaleaceae bacterium]|nr:hypothetical protein [Defluviitaleaceae bacterium]
MITLPIIDLEFKGLIPPLLPEEREQLEQNIMECRRCHDPIILWDGIIIDGHNRYEICMKYGIEFQIEELHLPNRETAKVWILENQLGRRNLTDIARMDMALLKEEMLREKALRNLSRAGGDKKSPLAQSSKPKIESVHVRKAIAQEAGVGETTLRRYEDIKKHGSPELIEKIQSGEIKIRAAHYLLPAEIQKQLLKADKSLEYLEKVIPEGSSQSEHPQIYDRLMQLTAALQELSDKLEKGGSHEAP